MSHSSGLVKFKNGNIYHYEYNGTVDVCFPMLYKTLEELGDNWRRDDFWKECTCGSKEWVQIFSSYGGGFYWSGKACEKCMVIEDFLSPFDNDGLIHHNGEPKWATRYYKEKENE